MHACMHVCMYVCMYVWKYRCTYVCIYVGMHMCTHVVSIHACIRVCVSECMQAYTCLGDCEKREHIYIENTRCSGRVCKICLLTLEQKVQCKNTYIDNRGGSWSEVQLGCEARNVQLVLDFTCMMCTTSERDNACQMRM